MFKIKTAPLRIHSWFAVVIGMLSSFFVGAQSLSHRPDLMFHDGFQGITSGPFTDSDASRFLAQATFGPTAADIAHLRSVGYQAWLTEQFAAAPTHEMTYLNWVGVTLGERTGQQNRYEAWFLGALGGPDPQNNAVLHTDQLRQRVAFALSEILVASDQNPLLASFPEGIAYYYDILTDNAFGNYRTLLEKVTLSPAMGTYLNMLGSQRANLTSNLHPDENYGREINQLFSIGLIMLNLDGTPKVPAAATYTQPTVTAFAHVFTGWNWFDCDGTGATLGDDFNGCGYPRSAGASFVQPMVAYDVVDKPNPGDPSYHDNGTDMNNDLLNKQLLLYPGAVNGGMLANGGSAATDLKFALDNIFNHPNLGPFVSKQLIQRLVTSNPSPAYVQRIATVFNDDGSIQHVRGNLGAVIQKIVLDPEARYGQWQQPDTFGKLREPLLRLTHFWRAMHAVHHCGTDYADNSTPPNSYHYASQPYRYAGYLSWNVADQDYANGVGQAPGDADTVFNFFKPGFMPSGEMTTQNLLGPEFQINTDSTITNLINNTRTRAFDYSTGDTCNSGDQNGEVMFDHFQDAALAGTDGHVGDPSNRLVDAYNIRFMSGQMSPFMRQTLITYLNTIDATTDTDWQAQRIDRALYLISTSPEYVIQK